MRSVGRSRKLLPLVIVTAVSLMILDAAGFTPIAGARRTAVSVGAPIGRLLGVAVAPVTDIWHGAVHVDRLEAENRELRRRNAELAGALAGQPDAEAELAALLEATEIPFLGDVEQVTARVVADRRSDVERLVEIDKGRDAGIHEGMPVATGTGLVGVVQIAAADRSVIRLLTDVETAVGVRSRYGLGVAAGTGDGRLRFTPSPELTDALNQGLVPDGVRFVTSGVDRSLFPSGIPVGSLLIVSDGPREVTGDPDPITGQVDGDTEPPSPAGPEIAAGVLASHQVELQLEPFAALDRLGYVTVLLLEPAP
ncbi:MAG: rod shape-determining protein MreC [Actinomycetota bacterium]